VTTSQRGMSDRRRKRIRSVIIDALHQPNSVTGNLLTKEFTTDEREFIQMFIQPEIHSIITHVCIGEIKHDEGEFVHVVPCSVCAQEFISDSKYISVCITCDAKELSSNILKRLVKHNLNCHGLHSALFDKGVGSQLTKPQITHFIRLNLNGLVVEAKDKAHLTTFYALTI